MTKELVTQGGGGLIDEKAIREQKTWLDMLDVVKSTVAKDSTAAEFEVFVYHAQKCGMDPLARQIYAIKRDGKQVIQASIDGMRLVAQRTGKYQGQTIPEFCGPDGRWVDVWLQEIHPSAARVGVHHKDFKEPLYGVARWDTYVVMEAEWKDTSDGKRVKTGSYHVGRMWEKMGDLMLAKCAEMLALRKAFPQELSGIYGKEEMDQADNEVKAYPARTQGPPKASVASQPASWDKNAPKDPAKEMKREASQQTPAVEGKAKDFVDAAEIPFEAESKPSTEDKPAGPSEEERLVEMEKCLAMQNDVESTKKTYDEVIANHTKKYGEIHAVLSGKYWKIKRDRIRQIEGRA